MMAALPNVDNVLCSTPQSLADARYWSACSNATKKQNPLKLDGVPQTTRPISAASGPKFTILWEHVEEILLLHVFSDCRYVPYLRKYSPTELYHGAQITIFGNFLRPVLSASRLQHVSDLRLKFVLRPHHVWKYTVDIQFATAEIRRGKKKIEEEETTGQKYNGLPYSIGRP